MVEKVYLKTPEITTNNCCENRDMGKIKNIESKRETMNLFYIALYVVLYSVGDVIEKDCGSACSVIFHRLY